MTVLRSLVATLFRHVTGIYFRRVELAGPVPGATTAQRLFAANHVNGLIDPILVLTATPAQISPIGKSTLWSVPVLRTLLRIVDAVPVARRRDAPEKAAGANEAVFARVGEHLARGGNVLIFPEGTSHSEPHVLRLKTGAARMLAEARAQGAATPTFQAVGLEFDARDTFRSRALVSFGPVRRLDEFSEAGEALVEAVTRRLADDLSDLLVEGVTWDGRRLVGRIAELYANAAADPSLATWNAVGREVEALERTMGPAHESLRARLEDAVNSYYAALDDAGLTDLAVVAGATRARGRVRRALVSALLAPLALIGAALYVVPYQVPRIASARLARGSGDVVSTYKLAASLAVFPLWAGGLVGAALTLLPFPASLAAVAAIVASPFACLRWLDRLDARRGRWFAPVATQPLRAQREAVVALLEHARAELARVPARDAA